MLKAIFFDFYGTLVKEDNSHIDKICDAIKSSSHSPVTTDEIGSFWYEGFLKELAFSHGDNFKLQRVVQKNSLDRTISTLTQVRIQIV